MNKTDLINTITERSDLSRVEIESIVDEFLQLIEDEVLKGKEVKLSNFGVFYKKLVWHVREQILVMGLLLSFQRTTLLGLGLQKS